MTQNHRFASGIAVAAIASIGLAALLPAAASAAPAAPAAPSAAASTAGANSPAVAIVADATYRGAEHHFMVLNVAAAAGKKASTPAAKTQRSKAVAAAKAALDTNVTALSTLLTENDAAASGAVKSLLVARDNDELAYAAGSLAVHRKIKGAAAKQAQALQSLAANETAVGNALSQLYPDTKAAQITGAFKAVDTADELSLEAASRTGVDRFPKAGVASTLLSSLVTEVAADEVTIGKVPGDLTDPNALARVAGAVVATQHVYLVGQFIQTGLTTGTGSGQTKAAQFWVNQNSIDVTKLLVAEGTDPSLTLASWTEHIEGYRRYTAYVATGHKFDLRQGTALLNGYEKSISNEIGLKLGLPATTVKGEIVEHVDGTELIARELKAGNPKVYADAEMGAQHLVDVFAQLAAAATVKPTTATPNIVKL